MHTLSDLTSASECRPALSLPAVRLHGQVVKELQVMYTSGKINGQTLMSRDSHVGPCQGLV